MDDDTAEDALEEKNEEIFQLKEKLESLASENSSLENMRTENNHLESQLKQREKEIEVLKEQNSNGALNHLKTEYKTYFNELEQKTQQFLNLIKEQEEEIKTLKKQKMLAPIKPVQTQAPQTRFLRPVKSQVPVSASAKARLGNLAGINVQKRLQSPPHLPAPNLLPDLVSSSKSGVAQYDQAPRYFQGQLPPLSLSSTFGPSQTIRTNLQSTQPFQPPQSLQPAQPFLSFPGDI